MEWARAVTKLRRRQRSLREPWAPSSPRHHWRRGKRVRSRDAAASELCQRHCQERAEQDRVTPEPAVGPAFGSIVPGICRTVARNERSEIRERLSGSLAAPGFRCAQPRLRKRRKQKGEAERRETCLPTSAPCGAAASHRGCPPLGVPPRFSPKGLLIPKAQRQAMLPGTRPERSILNARSNRGAKTLRLSTGVTRAGKERTCPSPAKHLARRS
jgi:hypothetical protein